MSLVSYELDVVDHCKRERQFYVNMIAPWNNPATAMSTWNITQDDEDDPNNIITLELSHGCCTSISYQLTADQQRYLKTFLDR